VVLVDKIASVMSSMNINLHYSFLTKKITSSFAIKSTGILLHYLLQLMLTRTMGGEQYGIYIYVYNWIYILVLMPKMGLDVSIIRYIPQYNIKKEWALLRGIIKKSIHIVFVSSLALSSILMIIILFYKRHTYENNMLNTFMTGSLIIPVMALIKIYESFIKSLNRPIRALFPFFIIYPAIMISALGLIQVLNLSVNSSLIMGLTFTALLISQLTFIKSLKFSLKDIPGKAAEYLTKDWICTSLPLFLISSLQILINKIDILIIGLIIDTKSAGIYAVAALVSSIISFPLDATNITIGPQISEKFHTGNINDLQKLLTDSMKIACVIMLPLILCLCFGGKLILSMFEQEYVKGYTCLMILVSAHIFNTITGSVGLILSMTGFQNILAKIMVPMVLLTIIFNITLIPHYGIDGAAVATMLTIILWNLISICAVKKLIGVNPSIFSIFLARS
jgi:O-antigen/teichoic acid export membrane protein